jgi:hypothetical protein
MLSLLFIGLIIFTPPCFIFIVSSNEPLRASQMFISILKSKLDSVQLAFDIEEALNFQFGELDDM